MKYTGLILLLAGLCSIAAAQVPRAKEVPFELVKNEPVAKVMINGRGPFNMMLDTGTDPSAIDLATAESIGIKRSTKGQAASGSGTERALAYDCKFESVGLGGLSVRNLDAAAIDLSKLSEKIGIKIDGVLGYSLFRNRVVQFDYPAHTLRFFDSMPATRSPEAFSTKFRYADNVLIEGVLVNGVAAVANLDTGSSSSFTISPRAIEKLGLADAAAQGTVKTSVGYNGRSEIREGKVGSIQVGTISVASPTVMFMPKGAGYDNSAWDINIGNGFFKDYVVTFDYKNKVVRVERSETPSQSSVL
jgi:predicted aspartyl protease